LRVVLNLKRSVFSLRLLCILLSIVWYRAAHSQANTYLTNTHLLSVEDGMASREVFTGLQDSKGFIWFGTRNGLNRYDGKNFQLFTQHEGLQANKVLEMAEDDTGNLWLVYGNATSTIRPNGQVDVFNTITHQVKSLTSYFPQLPFKENQTDWITPDGKQGVFICNDHSIWHYTHRKGFEKWYSFPDSVYLRPDLAYGNTCALIIGGKICLVQAGSAYFFTDSNLPHAIPYLIGFSEDGEQFTIVSQNKNKNKTIMTLKNGRPVSIVAAPAFMDSSGFMYYAYDPNTNSTIFQKPCGFFAYNNGQKQLLLADPLKEHRDMQMRGYFRDRTGKYWIYSSIGVYVIKTEPNKFTRYFTVQQLPLSFSNQARGIYADTSGNVYANIWGSICSSHYGKNGIEKSTDPFLGIQYPMLAYNDTFLLSVGAHILKLNRFSGSLTLLGGVPETWAAILLSDNRLLVSEMSSLDVLDLTTNKITTTATDSVSRFLYRFFYDRDSNLCAVGESGLYILNKNYAVTDYYGNKATDPRHHLAITGLNDICPDKDGIYWLATSGDGLLRWDKKTDSIQQFSLLAGFSSTIMYRIEPDNYGNLWISTDYGLARFNLVTHSVYTYTVKDGLSHNEFNRISSFQAEDGRMYFGGMNGVNAFYPKDFVNDTLSFGAPLRVTSFSQFERNEDKLTDRTADLIQQNKITLEPGDRFFNLEYRLLDYEQETHSYAYQIEGLDKQWNYITENSIRISGLPYGKFTLRVRAQNISGQWSEELRIPVVVIRPFYLEGWFFVLVALTIVALIYVFVYFRTQQLAKDNLKLENTVANRTTELNHSLHEKELLLKEIHHRVKNNLQTISSLLDLQSRNITDENTKFAIQEGQNRVRSIALIHQNLYQNETLEAIEFGTFMEDLSVSIKDVFLKPGFTFDFSNQIPKTFLDIDTAVPLGLIANELLTNSFKYAYGSGNHLQVTVNLKHVTDGIYIFELHDNGPGLPPDFNMDTAKSLGIRLVNRLSEQLDGKVTYHYDQGSVFEVLLKDTETRKREE